MPNKCGADAGRNGGSTGDRLFHLIALVMTLGLLVQGFSVPQAMAEPTPRTPETPNSERKSERLRKAPAARAFEIQAVPNALQDADRDSLMTEIRDYTKMIRSLRDSLSVDESGLQMSPAQREKLEGSISDISMVIESISEELSRMEFEIKDNRISLVNDAGEGIVINVPENLDEQVSEGFEAITKLILSEMPDSVDFDHSKKWDWSRFRPEPPATPRRIINGNIVKVWNDVHISDKEDVRGNVVVIFGNAEVAGRVDGSVVSVFGNLELAESAEVTGTVVAVGGYMAQDPAAQVDDVFSLDPWLKGRNDGWVGLFNHDGMSFLISQGTFLLTVLLAIVAVGATPRKRFDAITSALRGGVMPSLGTGMIAALVGHLVAAVLMAVLVLTVIGVPLALLAGMILLIVAVVSVAVCGAILGERLCQMFGNRCRSPWIVVVVGMLALHVVSFLGSLLGVVGDVDILASIFVVSGLVIKTIAYLLGLGALVNSRFGAKVTSG